MALAQTNQALPNEYNLAPPDRIGQADFRADSPDLSGFSTEKQGVAAKLTRRFHLTSRRRLALLIGLLFLGGLLLVGTLSALLGQTSSQQMGMSPTMERYWRNLDVAQVQKDMKGWSRDDLAKLFVTVREQTSDPVTRKNIDSLGRTLRLPGFDSSTSLMSALFNQPIFLLGIFLSIGIWGAAIVISIAPYVRWQRTPTLAPSAALSAPSEQSADAILEELLPEVTLEAASPDAPKTEEEEKKNEEPASEQSEEEASSGLGDLASLFEEEDTSITALEQFCKNLADITIDDLVAKTKNLARDLRAFVAQSAPRSQQG